MVREAETVFHDHLKRVGLKRTGQRDTILRTFLDTRDHLSTDELYRLVKKEDDGIGFDPVAGVRQDSFGLRGLQSLVEDGGGRLQVQSAPGAGTTVRMVVERG